LFFYQVAQRVRANAQDAARLLQITVGVAQNLHYVTVAYFPQSFHADLIPLLRNLFRLGVIKASTMPSAMRRLGGRRK
jgi:hypothetical protein